LEEGVRTVAVRREDAGVRAEFVTAISDQRSARHVGGIGS
jgi:hypothetical protein